MAKHRKNATLARLLTKAVVRSCLMMLGFVLGFVIQPFGGPTAIFNHEPPPATPKITPAESEAAVLLEKHDDSCWQGNEKPMAQFPSASIVRLASGDVIYTENKVIVDQAYENVIAIVTDEPIEYTSITPIALCV